jgi:hypothetical protein
MGLGMLVKVSRRWTLRSGADNSEAATVWWQIRAP